MTKIEFNLKIDEEFRSLIPPLTKDERRQLEENIVKDGCREPLCVWNNTILDGHNRYEICIRLGVHFSIAYIFLKNREAAVSWICANQLGRRNISAESRRYLIGKRYAAEIKIGAHNSAGINQYSRKEAGYKNATEPNSIEIAGRARERLGHEYNVSDHTVTRYGDYTKAIDTLSQIQPELPSKILSGKTKMTHNDVVALSRLSPSEIKSVTMQLSDSSKDEIHYKQSRQVMKSKHRNHEKFHPPTMAIAIKETPAYDPDAAVTSLFLTIPSWISVIERTAMEADYTAVSDLARNKLNSALHSLIETAQTMVDIIKEAIHEQ